jgi:hypothetical protein
MDGWTGGCDERKTFHAAKQNKTSDAFSKQEKFQNAKKTMPQEAL